MKFIDRKNVRFPALWRGCIGAWAPCLGQTGGTLLDRLGRDHGSLVNTAWSGKSLVFNGANSYVNFSGGIGQRTGSRSCSVSLWVNTTTVTVRQIILGDWNASGFGESFGPQIGWGSGQTGFAVRSPSVASTTTGAMSANVWTHLCFMSGILGSYVYVNGVLTWVNGTPVTLDSGSTFTIGRTGAFNGGYFSGEIADIRLYRRYLLPVEINVLRLRPNIAYDTFVRNRGNRLGNRRRRLICGAQC